MYTIKFYNKRTDDFLCYVKKKGVLNYVDNSYLTKKWNESVEQDDKDSLIKYAMYVIGTVFKKHGEGTMSEHEFNHMKKDYFNSVKEEDVGFRVFNKIQEDRKMKIKKIKKRIK